jgi:hypothetical protein
MEFNNVWKLVTSYGHANHTIETLDRHVVNKVIEVTENEIVVMSEESKDGIERHLRREDFRYVWHLLSFRKSLFLDDIDPELRGRKAIIFAILAGAGIPNVSYRLGPLMLHLDK